LIQASVEWLDFDVGFESSDNIASLVGNVKGKMIGSGIKTAKQAGIA
jgi:hypothetical protein